MRSREFFAVIMIGSFLFLSLFLPGLAHAQEPCDVDGNGFPEIGDAVDLINYLFRAGPDPLVRTNADCDNCPGIDLGDALQTIGVAMHGEEGFPPVGTDRVVPSGIEIITPWVDGDLGEIVTEDVRINTVDQPDLYALVIPLSYQNLPDQAELECIDVDFTGTLLEWENADYWIDNLNRKVLIAIPQLSGIVIPTGSEGVIAHITFEVLAEGDPTKLTATHFPPENTMLLISNPYYEAGDPPGRMLLPKFDLSVIGDVNGDCRVTISDVVYLINFMFRNGPPLLDF